MFDACQLTAVALFMLIMAFRWAKDDVIKMMCIGLLIVGMGAGIFIGIAIAPSWGPQ